MNPIEVPESQYNVEVDTNYFLFLIIALVVLAILWIIFKQVIKYIRKNNKFPEEWRPVVLSLSVPKIKTEGEETIQKNHEAISMAENLFSTLGGLEAQRGFKAWLYGRTDVFSMEMVANKGMIEFYLAVPQINKDFVVQQLHAIYPHINIDVIEDYNIFQPQSHVVAAALKFSREFIFPIKTYTKLENDPLNIITTSLGKIDETEGAAVQLVMRSAYKKWHYMGNKVASTMQQGKSLEEALASVGMGSKSGKIFNFIFKLIKAASNSATSDGMNTPPVRQISPMEQELIKNIEEKSAKAGLDVNLRVIVSANSEQVANAKLNDMLNSFGQFSMFQQGNSFKIWQPKKQVKRDKIVHDYIYRNFDEKYKMIMNTEEAVSLWHMPLPNNATPNIRWLGAKKAAPPVNLPTEGVILGKSEYRGITRQIRLKRADRRRHVYIIGQTGVGKSTVMKNMMIQDMQNGEGCCVIDPHGDFAMDMLKNVPKERAEDVIYFNPTDTERPLALNMLEYNSPEQKTFVVNELLSIFDKLYDLKATGGPMFEQYMRNALLLIMDDPESGMTLMEIPRVLADEDFRALKLSKCKNQSVKDFWEKEAQKAGGEASLANMVPYITSKLTPFIANDLMRPIIAQQKSSIDFRQVMDNNKILIVNLTKGKLGDINSSLLGMIIVGKILLASLSRVDMDEDKRKDFYLYIDEFQNFTTDSIAVILSEARKYKLNLVIAHQYIGQLVKNNDTAIRDAVFGNVGTTIAYRVGVDDAEILAKQFAPVFNEYDVVNVPKYTAYAKILIDNANPPAFNISFDREPEGKKEMADAVIELSRLRYGRAKEEIEAEIKQRASAAVNVLKKEE
ncbi:MAG: type IV secretory system conjugative DNA transfer family protein [Candidatus Komeilibacteria bacterium]